MAKSVAVGRRLRQWRLAHKYSQTGLAVELGVCQTTISDLEHGLKGIGLELALRIERATKGAVPAEAWLAKSKRRSASTTRKSA